MTTKLDGPRIVEEAVKKMIFNERFFADFVLGMRRIYTDKVATLGVNVTDTINLYINHEFFSKFPQEMQIEFLKHECYHVMNNHFERHRALDPDAQTAKSILSGDAQRFNIAADAAINEYLPALHKDFTLPGENKPCQFVTVDRLRKELKNPNVKNKSHTEYYWNLIQDYVQNNKGKGKPGDGMGQLVDDHSIWAEGNGNPEIVKQKIKAALKKAIESAKETDPGSVPHEAVAALERLSKPLVDWKSALKRFVNNATEHLTESSRKVRNRRYGIVYPGSKTVPKLKLALCVDTSGSISDKELAQFFTEIDVISRFNTSITVIECDCQVTQVYPYKTGQKIEAKGRGGTAYQPAIDKALEVGADAIIFFGDMDSADEPKKPAVPVMWAITGNQSPPAKFGSVIRISSTRL